MSALDRVLAAFPDARPGLGGYHKARCRAHEDRHASLSFWERPDGSVGLKCFAGCSFEAIAAAAGLDPRELHGPSRRASARPARPLDPQRLQERPTPSKEPKPPKRARPLRNHDVAYVYTDEDRIPLHRTVRSPGRVFYQERWDAELDAWVVGLGDVRRVLYGLPELRAADPRTLVFVCEGEKDVETLRALGFLATTNAMGANAPWLPSYTEALRGRDAVLFEDNDDSGRKRVQMAAAQLYGAAARVRIVTFRELPERGDITDWVERRRALGRSDAEIVSELDDRLANANDWTPPASAPPELPSSWPPAGRPEPEEEDPYDPALWEAEYGISELDLWRTIALQALSHLGTALSRAQRREAVSGRQGNAFRNRKAKQRAVTAVLAVNEYLYKSERGYTDGAGWAALSFAGGEQRAGSFADGAGCHEKTISRHFNDLHAANLGLELRTVPGILPDGTRIKRYQYRIPDPAGFLDNFAGWNPQDGRFKGEEPKLVIEECPDHPGADVLRYDTYVCAGDAAGCGTLLLKPDKPKRIRRASLRGHPDILSGPADHEETHEPDVDPRDLQPIASWNADGQEVTPPPRAPIRTICPDRDHVLKPDILSGPRAPVATDPVAEASPSLPPAPYPDNLSGRSPSQSPPPPTPSYGFPPFDDEYRWTGAADES